MKETMNIYEKLSKVKAEIGVLSKNATNPFFKSDYLDLNGILSAVEPLLEKHGLLCLQPITDGKVVTFIYDIEDGSFMDSEIALPQITDPQKLGSAITYFRRYTLQSLLALQAVDDDGQSATETVNNQLPPILASKFNNYLEWILNGTEDSKGVVITEAYLRARHTLSDKQAQELANV